MSREKLLEVLIMKQLKLSEMIDRRHFVFILFSLYFVIQSFIVLFFIYI